MSDDAYAELDRIIDEYKSETDQVIRRRTTISRPPMTQRHEDRISRPCTATAITTEPTLPVRRARKRGYDGPGLEYRRIVTEITEAPVVTAPQRTLPPIPELPANVRRALLEYRASSSIQPRHGPPSSVTSPPLHHQCRNTATGRRVPPTAPRLSSEAITRQVRHLYYDPVQLRRERRMRDDDAVL